MKDISLKELEVLRVEAEDSIRKIIQEFFSKTELPLYVDTISQSMETRCGPLLTVDVKAKVILQ